MMHLYAVALGMGTLSAFFEIADQSYLPTLVSRRRITEANSKLATTTALAETGGPALTGALVQGLSAPIAIAFDALAFLVSGCALLRIRRREKLPAAALAAKRPLWRGVQEGWAASFAEPEVRAVFVANVMIAFFAPMFVPVYAYYAIHDLGMTPLLLGFAISCGGAGALAGAALTPVLARRFGIAPMLITGLSMLGVAQLLVPLAHGRPEAATGWLAIAQFIGDGFFVFYLVNELSVRQQTLAPAVLGRANASLRMATGALAPAGILLAGLLADAVGPRPVLWISVGGILGTALLLAVLLPSRITSPRAAVT
jgi:MFS family permease